MFRITRRVSVLFSEPKIPQSSDLVVCVMQGAGFSALQRAENSSMQSTPMPHHHRATVSVLFSEPKIPQFLERLFCYRVTPRFSALQRAENSSIAEAVWA